MDKSKINLTQGQMPYSNPTPGELPIVGTGNLPDNTYYGKFILNKFSECNLNIAQSEMWSGIPMAAEYVGNEMVSRPTLDFSSQASTPAEKRLCSNIQYSLENVEATGLNLMVRVGKPVLATLKDEQTLVASDLETTETNSTTDWQEWNHLLSIVSSIFKNSAGLSSWMLADEARAEDFKHLGEAKSIIERNSDRLQYVNLLPCWSKQSVPSGAWEMSLNEWFSYLKYLFEFYKEFAPSVWSYDLYAFREKPVNVSGQLPIEMEHEFFRNLWIFWKNSQLTGIPFWPYIRLMTHEEPANYADSILSVEKLRYQAYMSLAFGAQGLVCWNMVERPSGNADQRFLGAPIKADGSLTPAYYNLQEILSSVRKYQAIFLNGTVTDIAYTNAPAQLFRNELSCLPIMETPIGPLVKIDRYFLGPITQDQGDQRDIQISVPTVLVSRVENNGEEYIIIVNLSWKSSNSFQLTFSRSVKNMMTNQTIGVGSNNYKFNYTLAPSDWVIFKTIATK